MSTTSAHNYRGQTPIRKRRRGDTGRDSEALRAAIVEANYLNQISGRPGLEISVRKAAPASNLTNLEDGGVILQ